MATGRTIWWSGPAILPSLNVNSKSGDGFPVGSAGALMPLEPVSGGFRGLTEIKTGYRERSNVDATGERDANQRRLPAACRRTERGGDRRDREMRRGVRRFGRQDERAGDRGRYPCSSESNFIRSGQQRGDRGSPKRYGRAWLVEGVRSCCGPVRPAQRAEADAMADGGYRIEFCRICPAEGSVARSRQFA